MQRPPRDPKEPILGAFFLAVTISFLTLAFARLWHVFNMRDTGSKGWPVILGMSLVPLAVGQIVKSCGAGPAPSP